MYDSNALKCYHNTFDCVLQFVSCDPKWALPTVAVFVPQIYVPLTTNHLCNIIRTSLALNEGTSCEESFCNHDKPMLLCNDSLFFLWSMIYPLCISCHFWPVNFHHLIWYFVFSSSNCSSVLQSWGYNRPNFHHCTQSQILRWAVRNLALISHVLVKWRGNKMFSNEIFLML